VYLVYLDRLGVLVDAVEAGRYISSQPHIWLIYG
jgi:hypothetical protein